MVRDTHSGKYRRTRLFVMTLGYSRKSVRLLVFRSSSQIWAELHEKAFRRLGGVTRVMVLDNLREGVLVPDIYDPTVNPLYRDRSQNIMPIVRRSSRFTTLSTRSTDRICASGEGRNFPAESTFFANFLMGRLVGFHRGWQIRCGVQASQVGLRWHRLRHWLISGRY
jgi:hypothetical protein